VDIGATAINPLNSDLYWYNRSNTTTIYKMHTSRSDTTSNEVLPLPVKRDIYGKFALGFAS